MSPLEITRHVFLALGTFFCLVAALGLLRMPDVFLRIHTATKASTLGVSLLALATAMRFADTAITAKSLLIILFLFLTAPVSAHLVGRAARMRKNPMSDRTSVDEFEH